MENDALTEIPGAQTSGVTIRKFAASAAITQCVSVSLVGSSRSLPAGNSVLAQTVTGTGEEFLDEHTFLHPVCGKIAEGLAQFAPGNDIGCLRIVDECQRPDLSLGYAAQLIAVVDLNLGAVVLSIARGSRSRLAKARHSNRRAAGRIGTAF